MDAREIEDRRALLSVTCPWCHALRGEQCSIPDMFPSRRTRRSPRTLSSLPHGCHDARWQAAGMNAPQVSVRV